MLLLKTSEDIPIDIPFDLAKNVPHGNNLLWNLSLKRNTFRDISR